MNLAVSSNPPTKGGTRKTGKIAEAIARPKALRRLARAERVWRPHDRAQAAA
jgi:hypothetical protein